MSFLDVYESIGQVSKMIRDYRTNLSVSLPDYLKTTSIMSRMYIQDGLYDEDALLPTIGLLNQLYAGFVITALQLNQYVTGTRTVRNVLELVSTEAYKATAETILNSFGGELVMSMESKGAGANVLDLDYKEQKLVSGRVIEISMAVPGSIEGHIDNNLRPFKPHEDEYEGTPDRPRNMTISMMVQLIPYLITENVTSEFLALNFEECQGMRYKKMRAGEIEFLADFIFERDLINNRSKALKEDRSGLLFEMISSQTNALSRALLRYANILPKNHNIANTLFLVDDDTFNAACASSGINFSNKSHRDKFFKESLMMMVVTFNRTRNKVYIYFNGLDARGEYNYKMIQSNASAGSHGSDKYDLKDIMTSLSNGMTPKF